MQSNTFQYTHSGAEGESTDFIFLLVSDGAFQTTTTITVNILQVDKSAPVLLPSSSCQINVTEGETDAGTCVLAGVVVKYYVRGISY